MNDFQVKRFQKKYHTWSKTVQSVDFRLTPMELQKVNNVSSEEFRTFLQLPYCRTNDGIILINEALPDWQLMKDLLLALDRLPDSLLLDIYRMDSKRYYGVTLDDVSKDAPDEAMRKILYRLLPEIVWAHGNLNNEN